MVVQLGFDKPLEVSTGYMVDRVLIWLFYYDEERDLKLYTLDGDLPQMVRNEQELQQLESTAAVAGSSAKTFLWIYLLCNIFLSFAISMLWGMI